MNTEIPQMKKPYPVPTPVTKPYWDALAERRIVVQYSPSEHRYVFYPRVLAPGTLAADLEWREISGAGTLYTYAVAERPVAPMFADSVPQILAIVQWDEGPRISTEIVNASPDQLEVGMRVRPVFRDFPEEDITMLFYEPEDVSS